MSTISIHMTDLYHSIYENEIFVKSRCIWHENTLLDFFRSQLIALGYTAVDDSNKTWRRGDQTVVVCLVDDFTTCNTNYDLALPYMFDRDTVVITDTWCGAPTQYQVARLPDSFFGIYAHQTEHLPWKPQRRFNFAVNRLDAPQPRDYKTLFNVNTNCWNHSTLKYMNILTID